MAEATIAVVGGGITGLASARMLKQLLPEAKVLLFEAGPRLGGKVETHRENGYLVELGPDSFLARKPHLLRLARELGMEEELLPTEKTKGLGSYIWSRGRLRRLPEGLTLMVPAHLSSFLASDLISCPGKLRALLDLVLPPRHHGPDGDESLASLVGRRLGREVLERIAEPLIAGIHAAPPGAMSLRASFPLLLEMEDKHGSLIRAAMAMRRSTPPSPPGRSYFLSMRQGLGSLIDALAADLLRRGVALRTNTRLEALGARRGGHLVLRLSDREEAEVDGLVLAVPASSAAPVLAEIDPEVAGMLQSFPTTAVGVYAAAFRRTDLPSAPLGHGFVVPAVEGRRILGVTYLSEKWRGRAPEGEVLLRAFVGGQTQGDLLAQGPEAVRQAVREELSDLLGVTEAPRAEWIKVWEPGLPAYTLGHLERVRRVEDALMRRLPTVRLAGASYHGIGLPDCVASGEAAAESLVKTLGS